MTNYMIILKDGLLIAVLFLIYLEIRQMNQGDKNA